MSRVRTVAAAVVLVLAAVLVPVASAAWWVSGTVTDTDAYVATVAPLATDPEVVAAAETALTDRIMELIEQQQVLDKAATALEDQGLPPVVSRALDLLAEPLRDRVQAMVSRAVDALLESPAFAQAWTEANRSAHEELIAVLRGDRDVVVQDGTVSLQLATLSNTIRNALVNAGVPGAESIPTVQATLPLAKVSELEKAQAAYRALDAVGRWLPVLTLLLAAGGIALARHRRRAALRWSVGSLAGLGALLVGLAFARRTVLAGLPGPPPHPAAESGFDILTERLRGTVGLVALVLVVLTVVLAVTGPSAQARTLRTRVRSGWDGGLAWGRSRPWVPAAAWAVAGALLLALLLRSGSSIVVSVLLALGAAAAAAVGLLARPPDTATADPERSLEP